MPLDAPPPVAAVVVEAARLAPSPADAPFAVVEISSEAIATAPRVDEALTATPGVQLFRRQSSAAANPTIQGIAVRAIAGSGAGRALVTLDGAPQNDPFGGWVIWSGLPTAAIEGARIVRGSGAGPYGAGALTGVIELRERASVPEHGEYALHAGERGLRGGSAAVGGHGVLAVVQAEHSDGWVPVREGRGAADRALALDAASASVRWSPAEGVAVRLSAYREAKGGGVDGVSSRAAGGALSLAFAGTSPGIGNAWRVQAWARRSDLENHFAALAPDRSASTPASEQYAVPAWGYGANAALRHEGGQGGWEVGADARLYTGETRERSRLTAGVFTRGRIAGGDQSVAGLYAEAWREAGPWRFTGGARLDRWDVFDGERIDDDAGTVSLTRPEDRGGVVPTARAGLRRAVGEDGFLRASAYAGFRPPTLNELHRPFRVGNDITEANPALEPERLYGLEAGAGGATWSLGAFYNRLEGPVTNVTLGQGPGVLPALPLAGFIPAGGVLRQRRNGPDIDAYGLEAQVERRWEGLTLAAAASWTHAEVADTGLRPAQTPRLAASAEAAWRPWPELALRLSVRHEGARFDDDLNTRRLGAATEAGLRADWTVSRAATLYAAIDNLTDAAIETAEDGDGIESFDAPRTVRVGLLLRP